MPDRVIPGESWEQFDAEGLFPPPRLHTNKLIKVDGQAESQSAGPDSGFGELLDEGDEKDAGAACESPIDAGHVDELFEMEGSASSEDDREVVSDKEEDRRAQGPEQSEPEHAGSEPSEDGADQPVQKESEGVEEVAEAISKTSEDVHGGDEATKDIEDSLNAANDGQNPENDGAESGEGGENEDGEREGEGESSGNTSSYDAEGEARGNPFATEQWEGRADHSATALRLLDDLDEVEAKVRAEEGHRTSLPSYDFLRKASPAELEIAFRKSSDLLKKFVNEEEFTARIDGSARWSAEKLVRHVISHRHQRIPSAKYEHPKEADVCILLDISGSCAEQAEMFMAIAAGSIGGGVRVFVGYNGSCRAAAMNAPKRAIRSYAQAKPWVQTEVERVSGWDNASTIGEWDFEGFLEEARPKTVIIFGDWDGRDQYTEAVQNPRFRNVKFFWFANEGEGWRSQSADTVPRGFRQKNYVPGIYTPRDFVRALRKLR